MKTIKNLIVGLFISTAFFACQEISFGNDFLGDVAEQEGATTDTMFATSDYADRVLVTAYSYLRYPLEEKSNRGSYHDNYSDISHTYTSNSYLTGTVSARTDGWDGGNNWIAIRYAWLYLENIDKVKDMTETEINIRKAEAKMVIAVAYSDMFRDLGGLPWVDSSIDVTEAMSVQFPRETFAQTVERIVTLCDEAAADLPWTTTDAEDGRMTKAAAMALKLRVLLFAASPTFNSATAWNSEANEYVCYGDEDAARWTRAKTAGEEFFSALAANGVYGLVTADEATHTAYRLAYRKGYYERTTGETLISIRDGYSASTVNTTLYAQRYYMGPTLNYIDMFAWEDGTEFPSDFDWTNPSRQPFYEVDGTPTREPRLYETAALPGSVYYNATYAPTYLGHDSYRSGICTGFLMMKYILTTATDRADIAAHFSYLRMPEVLLSYAEAINEADGKPSTIAYDCVNQVRARVGLPALPTNLTQAQFREAVLNERALEFGQEEVRWYDLVRWGMDEDLTKELYCLVAAVAAYDGSRPSEFTFEKAKITDRYWRTYWDSKWYLMPVDQTEIDKGYGWTQNPGW